MHEKESVDTMIQLAILNKTLTELNERQKKTELMLYGNGHIEGSLTWSVSQCADRIEQLNKQMSDGFQSLTTLHSLLKEQVETARLGLTALPCHTNECPKDTWADVLKKVTIKSPYPLLLSIALIVFRDPSLALLNNLLTFFQ